MRNSNFNSRKIEYQRYELIGGHGVKYLEELDSIKYTSNGRSRVIRQALFSCGYCDREFISRICTVKRGDTSSCGCFQRAASAKNLFDHKHGCVRDSGEKWIHIDVDGKFSVIVTLRSRKYLGKYETIQDAIVIRDRYLRENNPLIVDSKIIEHHSIEVRRIENSRERVKYQSGDEVGNYGMKYLEERPPKIWTNSQNKKNTVRNALFKCGCCDRTTVTQIRSVKSGNTKSCGCRQMAAGFSKKQPIY